MQSRHPAPTLKRKAYTCKATLFSSQNKEWPYSMSSLIAKMFKGVALIGVGAAVATLAPSMIEHLPLPKSMSGQPVEQVTEGTPIDLNSKEAPKPPSIRVIAAAEREITQSITATGSIMPRIEALVGADVAGLLVEELYFDVGDVVKKGDRLARLDRSNLELQLAQFDAQAAQNDANLSSALSQSVDAEIAVKDAQELRQRRNAILRKTHWPVPKHG
jgi:multidrug efflux pump subunit AcrA (membrane-fusion protein)